MKIRDVMLTAAVLAMIVTGCSRKTDPPPAATSDSRSGSSGSAAVEVHGTWLTDFDAAKAKAAEESKDLLVDFSGSDWCYWCQRLDGEIFSKPAFIDQAGKHFVFVKIDFPSDMSAQSRQLQAQNQQLAQRYRIQGYPTVILMRPDGTPYAETGYLEGGPDAYLKHLEELRGQR